MRRSRLAVVIGRTPPVLVVALAAGLLAACGATGHPTAGSSASARSAERTAEARVADYARCMREHGVAVEAVAGPSGGRGLRIGNVSQAMFARAQAACARYRPRKPALTPQQRVQQEEDVRGAAKCLREHGIDVAASTAGGGAPARLETGRRGTAGSGVTPKRSAAFRRAMAECQKLLPKPGA